MKSRQERFAELLGRSGDRAYNFAYRLTGNEQDAQDLAQEAFLKAFERLDEFDAARSFDAWLGTILHNIFVDGVRRLSHRQTVSMDAGPDETALADVLPEKGKAALDGLLGRESEAVVQAALARLEPEMRAALALCDMEGLSYEAAAEAMGCPIGTVRSRLFRAREKLRRMLEPYMQKGESVHGNP